MYIVIHMYYCGDFFTDDRLNDTKKIFAPAPGQRTVRRRRKMAARAQGVGAPYWNTAGR